VDDLAEASDHATHVVQSFTNERSLETMFDLPGLEGVEEVVISREVVEGTARLLYIYADRSDRAVESSAMAYWTGLNERCLRTSDPVTSFFIPSLLPARGFEVGLNGPT
jgi:hypothetical protein